MLADIIQIRWDTTDSQILRLMSQISTTSTTSTRISTPHDTPSTAARPTLATSTVSPPIATSSSGQSHTPALEPNTFSAGDKVVIGLGATMGVIIIGVLAFLLGRRRTRRSTVTQTIKSTPEGLLASTPVLNDHNRVPEFPAESVSQPNELPHFHARLESDSRPLYESPAAFYPELLGSNVNPRP